MAHSKHPSLEQTLEKRILFRVEPTKYYSIVFQNPGSRFVAKGPGQNDFVVESSFPNKR